MSFNYSVTISVRVHDHVALRKAAAAQARRDGLSTLEWDEMREDEGDSIRADLLMLLDGGLPDAHAGFEIVQSTAQEEGA